ncbi:tetratricopeptide repeat protein [Candidatus Amoebophilus asiaticus]|nr:tetratricopeptide repeat protein [Candidatus Amoebophilus asiaticus]
MLSILGASILIWNYQKVKKEAAAQDEMFQAVYEFEAGEYTKALQGDDTHAGFLDIIQTYGITQAANLAHFYSGVCYMQQTNYEEAIQHLKKFKAKDYLLQARAWSLIGDALVEQQSYSQAVQYYKKAAEYKPNEVFSPIYLVKAAIAYEAQKDYRNALKCYQKIAKEYTKSSLYTEAKKHIDRLEALM